MNVTARKHLQPSSSPEKKCKTTVLPAPDNPPTEPGSPVEDQAEAMAKMLRKSEEKYRVIFETANEGIWVTDAERKTVLVNQRMADMLGTARKDMLGRTPSEFLAPGQDQIGVKAGEDLKSGKKIQQEFKFKRNDGSDLWVISQATPVFDSKGRHQKTISMLADITERKRAEEEIKRRAEELKTANEELERFNRAMVARELQMIKLKKQINELSVRFGEPKQYELGLEEDDDTRRIYK